MGDLGLRYQASKTFVSVFSKKHPWIYGNALSGAISALPPASLVRVVDGENKFLTHAIYEPHASVAMRLLFTTDPFDVGQLRRRLASVISSKSKKNALSPTSCYRLLNGEGDRFPGLTCDVYGKTAIWQPYLKFWDALLPELVEEADAALGLERHVVKSPSKRGEKQFYSIKGGEAEEPIVFEENGVKLCAWPLSGQKTGFFIDLREVREILPGYSRGKSVLNCFAGTGAFTTIAKHYGATETLSIDADEKCGEQSAQQLELNGLPVTPDEWRTADVFDELGTLAVRGKKYDVVIIDPPNMCTKKASLPSSLKGWEKLLLYGKELTAVGGKLIAINCSSFMTRELCEKAVGGLRLKAESFGGLPPDHTQRAEFPEGKYLKWWVYPL